jgi:dGTP triphosphohydrolase
VIPPTSDDPVSLRQYLESLVTELDKRTEAQFIAAKEAVAAALASAEKAVAAALVASDKLTSAAFIAAKEALAEAQLQLTAYKAQSNEWRATLNDLISKMMMRQEIEARFGAFDARITVVEKSIATSAGSRAAAEHDKARSQWTLSQIVTIIAVLIAAATFIVLMMRK